MGEPQFVDGHVVGQLENGVFFQRMQSRHIYRRYNAKGIDKHLYYSLKGKCQEWRLEFEDTKQVISIPYNRIGLSGFTHRVGGGVEIQILVPLQLFDEIRPACQRRMI